MPMLFRGGSLEETNRRQRRRHGKCTRVSYLWVFRAAEAELAGETQQIRHEFILGKSREDNN